MKKKHMIFKMVKNRVICFYKWTQVFRCIIPLVDVQRHISVKMNNKDSIQIKRLNKKISAKISLFSLEKQESSSMYILVYSIAQQEAVEIFWVFSLFRIVRYVRLT